LLFTTTILLLWAGSASAQISLFSAIVEASPASYDQHLIKLTYMGPQKKSTASLGLHTISRAFDVAPFVPFYRVSQDYSNDEDTTRTAIVTTSEIDAFVARMSLFSFLTDNSDMVDPFLAVTILKDGGGFDVVWEGLYDEAEAKIVFGLLENRMLGNPTAKDVIHGFKINCFGL